MVMGKVRWHLLCYFDPPLMFYAVIFMLLLVNERRLSTRSRPASISLCYLQVEGVALKTTLEVLQGFLISYIAC